MPVFSNEDIKKFSLPGLEHQTLAARGLGISGMEVWMQTVAPGTVSTKLACRTGRMRIPSSLAAGGAGAGAQPKAAGTSAASTVDTPLGIARPP